MAGRFALIILLLALSGSIFAGVPLQSGERECSMGCCHKADGHKGSAEVDVAKLCCSVFCPQLGSTGSTVEIPRLASIVAREISLGFLKEKQLTPAKKHFLKFPAKVSLKQTKSLFILHHALLI